MNRTGLTRVAVHGASMATVRLSPSSRQVEPCITADARVVSRPTYQLILVSFLDSLSRCVST